MYFIYLPTDGNTAGVVCILSCKHNTLLIFLVKAVHLMYVVMNVTVFNTCQIMQHCVSAPFKLSISLRLFYIADNTLPT